MISLTLGCQHSQNSKTHSYCKRGRGNSDLWKELSIEFWDFLLFPVAVARWAGKAQLTPSKADIITSDLLLDWFLQHPKLLLVKWRGSSLEINHSYVNNWYSPKKTQEGKLQLAEVYFAHSKSSSSDSCCTHKHTQIRPRMTEQLLLKVQMEIISLSLP